MKICIVLALLATCLASAAAQDYTAVAPDTNSFEHNIAANVSSMLVESLGRLFTFLFNLFDIKVRFVRFITSLYTADNLALLKRVMSLTLRFGDWVYSIIPDSPDEGQHRLLALLVPQAYMNDKIDDYHFKPDDIESESNGIILNNAGDRKSRSADKEDHDRKDTYTEVNSLQRLVRGF